MFQGQSLRVGVIDPQGVCELCFDRVGEAINKFDDRTVAELAEAVQSLRRQPGLRGVLATSAKDVFIVGADITEFGAKFSQTAERIVAGVAHSNEAFVAFEDLPVPTVVAINGFALGGELEFALANSLHVMSGSARSGQPGDRCSGSGRQRLPASRDAATVTSASDFIPRSHHVLDASPSSIGALKTSNSSARRMAPRPLFSARLTCRAACLESSKPTMTLADPNSTMILLIKA